MNLRELYELEGGPLLGIYAKGEYTEEEFRAAVHSYYGDMYREWCRDNAKVHTELWRNVPWANGGMLCAATDKPGKGAYKVTVLYTGEYGL